MGLSCTCKLGSFIPRLSLHSQLLKTNFSSYTCMGWLGSRVVSVLDSDAEGLGSNRSRDAVR